jgi:hypothetical protein
MKKNRPNQTRYIDNVLAENELLGRRLDHLKDQVERAIQLVDTGFAEYVSDMLKQALVDIASLGKEKTPPKRG